MKVYEAVFKNADTQGMYALSLVENPAMEDEWIMLSEHPQEVELAAVDEEKRLLLGAALIPNKKIYRNVDGNEFYITFTAETIEKIGHDFFKKGNQNNSSLEHKIKLEGMSVVEAWTVTDSKIDKSATYGKSYEVGTLVTMMKVDNDEIWEKAKKGEVKGFSIDALLGLEELKLNSNIKMETKSIIDAIKDGFNAVLGTVKPETEVKLADEVTEEVMEEPQEEKVEEKSEVEQLKEALTEVLALFKVDQDKKIEDLRAEFSKKEVETEEVIEDLKTELDKTPEVEAIKAKPEVEIEVKKSSEGMSIKQRVLENLETVFN